MAQYEKETTTAAGDQGYFSSAFIDDKAQQENPKEATEQGQERDQTEAPRDTPRESDPSESQQQQKAEQEQPQDSTTAEADGPPPESADNDTGDGQGQEHEELQQQQQQQEEEEDNEGKRKLFIGGVPWAISDEEFFGFFCQFGQVERHIVIREKSGRSRGFGFVTFTEEKVAVHVISLSQQHLLVLHGRLLDASLAVPLGERSNGAGPRGGAAGRFPPVSQMNPALKVFVGGLSQSVREPDLLEYFSQFGNVTDTMVLMDPETNRSRGFGFVRFDSGEPVNRVIAVRNHSIKGKRVECKRATPKHGTRGGRGGRDFHRGGAALRGSGPGYGRMDVPYPMPFVQGVGMPPVPMMPMMIGPNGMPMVLSVPPGSNNMPGHAPMPGMPLPPAGLEDAGAVMNMPPPPMGPGPAGVRVQMGPPGAAMSNPNAMPVGPVPLVGPPFMGPAGSMPFVPVQLGAGGVPVVGVAGAVDRDAAVHGAPSAVGHPVGPGLSAFDAMHQALNGPLDDAGAPGEPRVMTSRFFNSNENLEAAARDADASEPVDGSEMDKPDVATEPTE